MIDPNRVSAAVMEFMKNPTWKDIFMNAPSGAMERLAISFYFSKFHNDFQPEDFQEYRDLREEYEKSLTEEDLNYLIEHSDKETAIKHYQELLSKKQETGGEIQSGLERFEGEQNNGTGSQEGTGTAETPPVEESEQVQVTEEGDSKTIKEKNEQEVERTDAKPAKNNISLA